MRVVDASLFHAINGLAGHVDAIDDFFAFIANNGPYFMIALLPIIWFWPGKADERKQREWAVIAACASILIGLGVNQVIIHLWQRPRPFVHHHATMLISHARDASFPSDHSTVAFALAFALLLMVRRVGWVALVMAIVLGFSRVYVGVHYVSDVAGAALIGFVVAYGVVRALPYLDPLIEPPLRLARRFRLA